MRKILIFLLCFGVLVGCGNNNDEKNKDSSNASSLDEALYDVDKEAYNNIRDVVNEYFSKDNGWIELDFKDCKIKDSDIIANYEYNNCEILFHTNDYSRVDYVSIKDGNMSNDKYSDDYMKLLEATLNLSIYDLSLDTRNKIVDYFNDGNDGYEIFDGYRVFVNYGSFRLDIFSNTLTSDYFNSENQEEQQNETEEETKTSNKEETKTNNSSSNNKNQNNSTPTMGQTNALLSAKDYLNTNMGFSYDKLLNQLVYEGYSKEEATYAVDNCGANWKEQAVISAKLYLSTSSFSKQRLIEQLEYEGFTHKQAVYGVEQNGY